MNKEETKQDAVFGCWISQKEIEFANFIETNIKIESFPFVSDEFNNELMNLLSKHIPTNRFKIHSEKLELLERYTRFLQKNGYLDTDVTEEEPYAIDEFMKLENKRNKS